MDEFREPLVKPKKVAVVLDIIPIGESLRPLRHIRYLEGAGFEVIGVSITPEIECASENFSISLEASLGAFKPRQLFLALRRLAGWLPTACFFRSLFTRAIVRSMNSSRLEAEKVALVLVEDISLLEPAIATFSHSWLVFDAREDHSSMIDENLAWRYLRRPEIERVKRHSLPKADRLITVSPRIQKRIASYSTSKTFLVPNVPDYRPQYPVERSGPLRIVFHGQVNPSRQIGKSFAEAATSENVEFHLYPMGQEKHLDEIERLANQHSNIFINQVVAPSEIQSALLNYDLGFVAYPPTNQNLVAALPNKFFEFVFSGLPPIVQAGSSMADYVHAWNFGFTVELRQRGALRELVDSISRDAIIEQRSRLSTIWGELSEPTQRRNFLSAVLPQVPEQRDTG